MAQTIAVQRGTATVVGNGTSRTTLFTQSSGTATRVILAGCSFGLSTGSSAYARMILTINMNGSGTYLPVAAIGGNSQSKRYHAMFPNGTQAPLGNAPIYTGTTPSTVYGSSGYSIAGGAYQGYAENADDYILLLAQDQTLSSNSTPISIVPSQFWMANGDSLTVQGYNVNSYTLNVAYHFITVTES